MKRRIMLILMLLGLGIASFPQVASAQSSPLIGTRKLNVEKSKSEHAKSTSARQQPGLGGRGEDEIERLMRTTGCSRIQASNVAHGYTFTCGPIRGGRKSGQSG